MANVKFLLDERFIVFTTRDFAIHHAISIDAASQRIKKLARDSILTHVTRGVWANTAHPYFSPYGAVPLLLGNEQGYVSFLSALHRAGIISQIPATIQIATTGRARSLVSPIGTYEFFHLKPDMFSQGIDWSEAKVPYLISSPEKALLDTFYVATRKGKRFVRLPELELEDIDKRRFIHLLNEQVSQPSIHSAVLERWKQLNHNSLYDQFDDH